MLRTARFSFFLILFHAKFLLGLEVNPRLVQLVPPQSRLVAGMSSSAAQGTTGSFLLITQENKADLADFFALTGGDASRQLQSLLFVTAAERGKSANEHSLLVSGQFDRDSIFRIEAAGTSRESYRGIPVLVVSAFLRERKTFDEVRWLAVPDAHIAVFGSVESVQRELDRWVDQSAPDETVLDGLHRLGGHDDSWCLLLARDREGIAETVLGKLDPKLGAVAHEGGLLGYGIKFGRKIEIATAADPFPARSWKAPNDLPGVNSSATFHLFSFLPDEGSGSRATVKVSRKRYEEWIGKFERDPLLAKAAAK